MNNDPITLTISQANKVFHIQATNGIALLTEHQTPEEGEPFEVTNTGSWAIAKQLLNIVTQAYEARLTDATTLDCDGWEHVGINTETTEVNYEAEAITLQVGRLEIRKEYQGQPSIGMGTEIYLDGVKLEDVARAELVIDPRLPIVLKAVVQVGGKR